MGILNKNNILIFLLCVTLSFAVFGITLKGDFVLDDNMAIVGNPFLDRNIPDFAGILTAPYVYFSPQLGAYRPLTILTFGLNYLLFGQSPLSFHVVNILLHASASWLVYFILKKYISPTASFISAIIFLVLPIHTEAVANIVGRAELLALIFSLITIHFASNKHKVWGPFFFFCALLSKETGAALLGILPFFLYFNGDNIKKITTYLGWYLPWLFVYIILRIKALGLEFLSPQDNAIINPLLDASPISSTITSLKVLILYLCKTIIPFRLSPDYSFNQISINVEPLSLFLSMLGISFLIGTSWFAYKSKKSGIILGWLIFLGSYFIVSNFVLKIGTIMGDRVFYMPSAGLIFILGFFINYLIKEKKMPPGIIYFLLAIIISFYGYSTYAYSRVWNTQEGLISYGYQTSPHSVVMKTAYAQNLFQKGNKQKGIELIDEVLKEVPDFALALTIRGNMHLEENDIKQAQEYWLKAIVAKSNALDPYINLGKLYYRTRDFAAAENILTKSVNQYSLWEHVQYLGLAKIKLGKYEEAIQLVTSHFGSDPDNQALLLVLGLGHKGLGNFDSANYYLRLVTDPRLRPFLLK